MDIMGYVLIGIAVTSLLVIRFLDPLEKYDKTLDDPDHKTTGSVGGLYLGSSAMSVSKKYRREQITFSSKDEKLLGSLEKFVQGAELEEKGFLSKDSDKANQGRNQVIDAFKVIKRLDPSFSNLASLLKHHSAGVRMETAARLLATNKESALPVLQEIDKEKGILGFTARMTIQQWEKGKSHPD
jgi:hypothetical protein